ncbi:MAG: DUF3078 domain-containing protein, partial [Muribaculum intestinale]|nr:DUF3078 domain-containing protein [Muribaculum intestinale]
MTIKACIMGIAALLPAYTAANAQAMYFDNAKVGEVTPDTIIIVETPAEKTLAATKPQATAATEAIADTSFYRVRSIEEIDQYLDSIKYIPRETTMGTEPLPSYFFLPAVFDHHKFPADNDPFKSDLSGNRTTRWLEEQTALNNAMEAMKYDLFSKHPEKVYYNIDLLPEAPKQYHAVVDPSKHSIEIREIDNAKNVGATISAAPVKKRHWIRSFAASLQFSQGYVSPSWYQGGVSSLNLLANIYYNVKLNQEYHPKLLFETTAQYKLGMNSAPDDSIHNYSISEDLLQINSTFGLKAAKRWYYSLTGQFKTQLLNSYPSNSREVRASFLSPAELTVGLGMTYNYANAKKTVTFDASIAPLSYNMRLCRDHRIDPALYNIDNGRRVQHNFGSSAELKFFWQITYNISYTSRLFAFTDYDSAQADWE